MFDGSTEEMEIENFELQDGVFDRKGSRPRIVCSTTKGWTPRSRARLADQISERSLWFERSATVMVYQKAEDVMESAGFEELRTGRAAFVLRDYDLKETPVR